MNCMKVTFRGETPGPVPPLKGGNSGTGAGSEPVPTREPAELFILRNAANRFPMIEKIPVSGTNEFKGEFAGSRREMSGTEFPYKFRQSPILDDVYSRIGPPTNEVQG